jgi:hypothetical protein
MVTQELLSELRVIMNEEFNRDLDSHSASDLGHSLIHYFTILKRNVNNLPKNEYDKQKNQHN